MSSAVKAHHERRNRPRALPSCEQCGKSDKVRVATRVDYFLYLRCEECRCVWSVPKPGAPTLGTRASSR